MQDKKKFRVETVVNTYEILWAASKKSMEDAKSTKGSPWYYYFTAMTMAYFCYEAYLNHLLQYIAPDVWENEREYFSRDPYKGTEGKLKKVCEIAEVSFPKKGDTTYQQIRLLKKLRDFVAHGKTERTNSIIEAASGHEATNIESTFQSLVSKGNAEKAIPAIQKFIVALNNDVRVKTHCDRLSINPLQGMSGQAIASEITS